ncbi:Serine/threonine protein kinase [Handroanthus impetiginosus]|uniref:Serine/threonine protein kinase n=1 Tax=Handroanthus impetiginosus TaxID=429701 RepID=A0A2G9H0M1_9LAMI|nr:Serine/threonine protein kinase [Handroanthus impetiginosus]
MIGRGGFGSVYKAVLSTGQMVAVKRFSSLSLHFNQFKSEIVLLSNLHHRNIVKLLGYCIHKEEGMLLYEFMENKSLDTYIFGERHQLQWSARFKIILGVTRGLIYLHQDLGFRIIHGDLKPSNILLDNEMNPKISGFGIAKSFEDDKSELETIVAGTLGYISPECFIQGKLSDKSDVYSFGVVVLEILSGKRYRFADVNLIEYAWNLQNEGKALNLVEESIREAFSEHEALRCIQVGLLCTQHEPNHRPALPLVIKMLLGEDSSLREKIEEAAQYKVQP